MISMIRSPFSFCSARLCKHDNLERLSPIYLHAGWIEVTYGPNKQTS